MSTGVPQAWLELIRSAVHEAGHAAVCLHFGVEFDQVTIRQFDGEVSRRLSESDQRSMSQAAREEIVIALAGAAAQRMFYPDQPEVESFFVHETIRRMLRKSSAILSTASARHTAKKRMRMLSLWCPNFARSFIDFCRSETHLRLAAGSKMMQMRGVRWHQCKLPVHTRLRAYEQLEGAHGVYGDC